MDEPTIPSSQPPQQTPPVQHQKEPNQQTIALSRQVADMLSRLRLMEERYANLRREHQLTSQNMIENHQGISKQQRRLNDNLTELKKTLQEVREQLDTMQGELATSANIHDVKAIERYLDLWQPLEFITREEAYKLIKDAMGEKVYKEPPAKEEEVYE